jgi:hypothetical protein
VGAIGDAVFPEHHRKRPEGVGLYRVDPNVKEGAVECFDDIGPGRDEDFVAAFKVGAAKVVGTEVSKLQVGSGRPVKDEDALREGSEIRVVGLRTCKRRTK